MIGAGPAGIAAAITLARAGMKPVVFDQASDVGTRFDGDYQGLENWSTDQDVTEFLASIGLSINFLCAPYTEGVFYGPELQSVPIRTERTWFYLVERGSGRNSLDQGLKRQAMDAGVEFQFDRKVDRANADKVIVATGPHAADAIARGVVFETSHPDACFGFLDERIAPRAYAYLLVHGGRGTLATCLFDDFANANTYFARALETIRSVVDFDLRSPRTFGGFVNFEIKSSWTRGDTMYFVGERAGFQDALWGFGLRYALHSGYLAARAILDDDDYDALCQKHLVPKLETSLANRLLYSQLGNHGYSWVLRRIAQMDVIGALQDQYNPSKAKRLIYEIAKRRIHPHLRERACHEDECSCIWCTHGKNVDTAEMDRCLEKHTGQ